MSILTIAVDGDKPNSCRWGLLIGHGRAFDPTRYFIFCGNALGSPYGSASPVTVNSTTGKLYGPEFPLTTIRDDVRWEAK